MKRNCCSSSVTHMVDFKHLPLAILYGFSLVYFSKVFQPASCNVSTRLPASRLRGYTSFEWHKRQQRGQQMAAEEILLTPREAAAAIGVSYATIKQWILAGKLETTKTPGGHHRISSGTLKKLRPAETAMANDDIQSRQRFRVLSGRNQLIGTIVEVKISGLLAKVVLAIGDQQITSIITADAVREMQLSKGQAAAALVKSTEVMIARV